MKTLALIIAAAALSVRGQAPDPQECDFVFQVDLFASETGYYRVDGYEGVQPELEMELNRRYTFCQYHHTNWYHPLGFAYLPDGAHEGVDELEEGVGNGDAPVYFVNGNLSELDVYEPEFAFARVTWLASKYHVELTVTDPSVREIVYFCHIHNRMSARIKITGGNPDPGLAPLELYAPYRPTGLDERCGTWDVSEYDRNNVLCSDRAFLCEDSGADRNFIECLNAIDCKMLAEMTVKTSSNDSVATFLHQMIPHHQNAVNMAKTLLKTGGVPEEDEEMLELLYDIINTQNAQITYMRAKLRDDGFPAAEDVVCSEEQQLRGTDSAAGVSMIYVALLSCVAAFAAAYMRL